MTPEEKLIEKLKKLEAKGHELNRKLFEQKVKWQELKDKLVENGSVGDYDHSLEFEDTQC